MEISVTGQTIVFLSSCIFGISLGIIYDIFRIFRIAVPCGKVVIFIQDILFWIISAVSTFVFLLYVNAGEIRLFVIIGELIGFSLYYFTLGYLVYKSSKAIIGFIKTVIKFFARLIFRPLRFISVSVYKILSKLFKFLFILIKKPLKYLKTYLHVNKSMLYNLIYKPRSKKTKAKAKARNKKKRRRKKSHEKTS